MNASSVIELSNFDLLLSGGLILITGILSLLLKLRLEKQLLIASIRTLVQLLLVGYILRFVFTIKTPWLLFVVLVIMVTVATFSTVGRLKRRIAGVKIYALLSLVVTALITTFTVTSVIINVQPWFEPRYVIPLMGMIVGNSMTAISLSLDRLFEEFSARKNEVEVDLALGATRWEAAQRPIREAVRLGMIPMINSMMVVGVVSLPGMMTGQILAGADPLDAVKYQIVVMFMISAATALACIFAALLLYRRMFNDRHQLLSDRIKQVKVKL